MNTDIPKSTCKMNLIFPPGILIIWLAALLGCSMQASAIRFDIVTTDKKVAIFYDRECALDSIVANLLAADIERISGYRPFTSADITRASGNIIIIGSVRSGIIKPFGSKIVADSKGKWECYSYR